MKHKINQGKTHLHLKLPKGMKARKYITYTKICGQCGGKFTPANLFRRGDDVVCFNCYKTLTPNTN